MTRTTKRKINRVTILVAILICIISVLYSCISYYPYIKSKHFVEQYGLEVINGGKDNTIILTDEFLNSELSTMQIEASSYIMHTETNTKIKYWSLDTPDQTIQSELNDIR